MTETSREARTALTALLCAGALACDQKAGSATPADPAADASRTVAVAAIATDVGAAGIITAPASRTAIAGSSVTFSVVASGAAPLSYQWARDGADLAGATGASLTLPSVQASDAGAYTVKVSNGGGAVTSGAVRLAVLDAALLSAFNLVGFATTDTGTTGGGIVAETDPAYAKVTTPLELATAIKAANKTAGAVKVIEIMNDLDLGYTEVGTAVTGLASSPFRAAAAAKLHPVLKASGVSVVDIKPKSGLTIFSASGATLRHAVLNIKGTSNVIVRNLRFDQNWEWDEASKGNYDKNDWDYIDIGNGGVAHHVWVDHCTFTKSYDGILDIKGGAYAITLSWNKIVGDDGATNPNSFVRQQLASLESCTACPFYSFLRSNGFSQDEIAQIIQGQDKTHLIGATDFAAENAAYTVTFDHALFKNTWDRHPRLRAGNVHVANVVVDDQDALVAKRLRDARVAAFGAAAAKTFGSYSFNPPLNGSISTEGGAILVEGSVYLDSLWPLRNNQTDPTNASYTGKIKAVDSIYSFHEKDGTTTYFRGSSTDAGAPFGPKQAALIDFSWNLAGGALPYAYRLDDPATLREVLETGAGAGSVSWPKANWLKTSY
jgi:pectate lyase